MNAAQLPEASIGQEDAEQSVLEAPLRVLVVSPSMRMVGGQAQQSDRLRRHLMSSGLVCPSHVAIDPELPKWLRPLQGVRGLRTIVNELAYLISLVPAVRRAEVVHIFSAAYYAFLLHSAPALLVARIFGRPVILNYRSGEAEDHLENWRWTALPLIRRLATTVVAPSGYLVDVFGRFGVAAQSIENFIELERFRFRLRPSVNPRILTNRLIEPLYNYPCLLRAFARVQGVHPNASLKIAGEGPSRPEIEALVRRLLLRNVEFVGRVTAAEMAELYDAADIYVTTPNVDCMPGSLLECSASGLPIVATRAGGIPYIVKDGETALLADVDDDVGISDQIMRLLTEGGLSERLGRNAREHVERLYVWPVVAGKWIALYRQLAGR